MWGNRRAWGAFTAFAVGWNGTGGWQQRNQPPFSRRTRNGAGNGPPAQRYRKKVIIVGGGFAGGSAAIALQDSFEVTLLDPKSCFENITAQYRVLCDKEMGERNRMPHEEYAPSVDVQQGTLRSIDRTHIVTGDNKSIPFDYLIVATGSHYRSLPVIGGDNKTAPVPVISLTDGDACRREQERLSSTKGGNLIVVGGGAAGVEVAAELAECYPDKTVHFVFSGDKPLSGMPEAAQNVAVKHFSKLRNIRMCPGERVIGISGEDGSVLTRSGKTFTDVSSVFLCVGFAPNTSFAKDSSEDFVDERGFFKVNRHLQSTEQENIFAIGDVTDVAENKLAQNAFRHAAIAAQNIVSLEAGRALKAYTPEERRLCIMLGRSNSVVVSPNGEVDSGWWSAKKKQGFALSARILPVSARMFASRMSSNY